MSLAVFVLLMVTLQRLSELWIAKRNTRWLLDRGGREAAPEHYPLIVALHAAWLIGLWIFAHDREVVLHWLGLFVVLQAVRVWILTTMGPRWTTRIIVLPDAPLVETGPFRWVSHPNYCVVVAEILLLPLAFGLVWYALVFSLLNAIVLTIRIRAENEALAAS
ncbi:MAG: isoprenylcysteine carboxyl methyltransferase family protein [Geminicoccaceae bacterium]